MTIAKTPSASRIALRRIAIVVFLVPAIVVSLLVAVAVLRTLLMRVPVGPWHHAFQGGDPQADTMDVADRATRLEHLCGALRIRSVSHEPGRQEVAALLEMHRYLEKTYPLVHSATYIRREVINEYSLLYTIDGTANNTLPYMIVSHIDVVPADEAKWEVPPFEGRVVDDFIYGRGVIDDKSRLIGTFESLEYILRRGERPRKSFYIAIGHDEELGGNDGAQAIAKSLHARGVHEVDFIFDEGYPMVRNLMPGVSRTLGMVGVTEKGSTSLQLTTTGTAGHSCYPPLESAIGILAAGIARLEANPQPSMFGTGPEAETFAGVAPYCSFPYRFVYGNLWLFSGLMSLHMSKSPVTNAMVRTTTAITLFNGGIKENVVPPSATAIIHLHIHPSQSVAQAVQVVKDTLADPRIEVTVRRGKVAREAHPVSPTGIADVTYQMFATTLRQVFPDIIVVPAIVLGNTDSRWYLDFTRNIYRNYPFVMTPQDRHRFHGDNERLSTDYFHNCVDFIYRLMRNADRLVDATPRYDDHVEL